MPPDEGEERREHVGKRRHGGIGAREQERADGRDRELRKLPVAGRDLDAGRCVE